jgi:hypothetical protein
MTVARVASVLRQHARAARRDAEKLEKLADELEATPVDAEPQPVNDLDVARAKRVKERLRRLGERT